MDITSYLLGKQAGGGSSSTFFEITTNTSNAAPARFELLTVNVASNVTSLTSAFRENSFIKGTIKLVGGSNNLDIGTNTFDCCYFVEKIDLTNLTYKTLNNIEKMFNSCENLQEIKGLNNLNINNVQYFSRCFYYCPQLTEINISEWKSTASNLNISQMFQSCSRLQKIDMRNFDFSNVTTYNNAFTNVPANCLIVVADSTQKTWLNTNFPSLTNVKTVAEYGG